ncbi:MAG: tRNA (guanosine(37)-N1)-methyltransferase TrmD [Hyphomicrobiales bacterium]|nr:tRNA (guanosine(37)-N1)-methyltransferase TrmD [Hyphomicrobiales bacterium]MCY4038606.1 tRNA (guanosine(37)-N1)-methyltransferase TrmD [Hyphomicrobiales bacterium]
MAALMNAQTHKTWEAWVLTLLPEAFPGVLGASVAGKALERGCWKLHVEDIRAFATDAHRSVDDTPAGGGAGMVMRADVVGAAVDSVAGRMPEDGVFLCMSARGERLTQERIRRLSEASGVGILCGRFEGIDQRVLDARGIEEVSVGDFVLAGGEISAMAVIEACVRLLPGVMGNGASAGEESFEAGLLEYPQYTRPRIWEGREIPDVLLSGDHERVRRWRAEEAEAATRKRRPDLWQKKERGN